MSTLGDVNRRLLSGQESGSFAMFAAMRRASSGVSASAGETATIVFGSENSRGMLLGDAADVQRSDTRKAIISALMDATDLMNPVEIAAVATLACNTVDVTLHRMAADGEVVQVSRGKYARGIYRCV